MSTSTSTSESSPVQEIIKEFFKSNSTCSLLKFLQYRQTRDGFINNKLEEHRNYKKALDILSVHEDYAEKARNCLATLESEKTSLAVDGFWRMIDKKRYHEEIELEELDYAKRALKETNNETHCIRAITTNKMMRRLRSGSGDQAEESGSQYPEESDDDFQPIPKKQFSLSKKNKGSAVVASKKVKATSRNVRAEGSTSFDFSRSNPKATQFLEMPIGTSSKGATEMTNGTSEVSSPEYNRPHTPPHQIRSTSKNHDLLKRLRQEKQRAKSMYEPICSSIIDTTNKPLMDRLEIKRDYTWDPVTNEATKYIDELIDNSDTHNNFRCKLQLPFVPPDKTYSFNKHYEMNWVHCFANKLLSFFEAPRKPLLDKNSEGWLNCHILTLLIDDCFLTCEEIQVHRGEEMSLSREESRKKQSGHKIDILFHIDNMEYFGSEMYTDEDPQNSKPISCKQKLFRELKDQLDRLLKSLKFTKESIKGVKNIVLHGIIHGGLNGKMYAMYYDADVGYYFVFKTCQYRIGTTWGSIPESLVVLKDVLCLKNNITNVFDDVKKVKRVALKTRPEDLFTIDNLPEMNRFTF